MYLITETLQNNPCSRTEIRSPIRNLIPLRL
ncbi:Protein of unknown function [Pyronema omphalodes CBS 100304]|uniref:Uncharacterized protein n=1 Tax=Pyronema omphalodes (strain CBS 100304) TaxID=1076935 RepID=U4KZU8_PYROM|nr:Protein of unknown function [Pyronema omphalodes CBS 100304]